MHVTDILVYYAVSGLPRDAEWRFSWHQQKWSCLDRGYQACLVDFRYQKASLILYVPLYKISRRRRFQVAKVHQCATRPKSKTQLTRHNTVYRLSKNAQHRAPCFAANLNMAGKEIRRLGWTSSVAFKAPNWSEINYEFKGTWTHEHFDGFVSWAGWCVSEIFRSAWSSIY